MEEGEVPDRRRRGRRMKRLLPALLLVAADARRLPRTSASNATNYDGGAWSPYLVGAGIGVLSWLTFYFADKAIGASSFYATLAGLRRQARRAEAHRVAELLPRAIRRAWTGASSSSSARSSAASSRRGPAARFRNEWLHPMWVDRFGDSIAAARHHRLCRRRADGLRRAPRGRLHERPRHQRHASTQRRLVAHRRLHVHRRHRHRHAALHRRYDRSRQSREGIQRAAAGRGRAARSSSAPSSSASPLASCCKKAAWANTTSCSASCCSRTSRS